MAASTRKPFYTQPPWNVLFDFHKLKRLKPWSVDIAFLLTSFLEEMEKRGEVDFRASGVALGSSAFIYLMKSKLLLRLEEPPAPPKAFTDVVPPPLFLPLRYELTSTTIQHLLHVLDEVLKGERLFPLKMQVEPILPPPIDVLPKVDRYLMEIEERMDNLYGLLLRLSRENRVIAFSRITSSSKRLEIIKTFLLLLFLAQNGKVNLWQEEEFGEIYITLAEGSMVED